MTPDTPYDPRAPWPMPAPSEVPSPAAQPDSVEPDEYRPGYVPVGNTDVPLTKADVMGGLGARLRRVREVLGIDQDDAAKALGYFNSAHLSLFEYGKKNIPVHVLVNAATVYGVSTDYLLGLSPDLERGADGAGRAAVLRDAVTLLERNARQLATRLLTEVRTRYAAQPLLTDLTQRASQVQAALARVRELNPEAFDELRGGAPLVKAVTELAQRAAVASHQFKTLAPATEDLDDECTEVDTGAVAGAGVNDELAEGEAEAGAEREVATGPLKAPDGPASPWAALLSPSGALAHFTPPPGAKEQQMRRRIGARFVLARKRGERACDTQRAADQLGVPAARLRDVELGRELPDVPMLLAASGLYLVSVDYLLGQPVDPDEEAQSMRTEVLAIARSLMRDSAEATTGSLDLTATRGLEYLRSLAAEAERFSRTIRPRVPTRRGSSGLYERFTDFVQSITDARRWLDRRDRLES